MKYFNDLKTKNHPKDIGSMLSDKNMKMK